MWETAAWGHINPVQRPKPGSFGCPVPNMHAAILDPLTLEFVAPGTTGALVLSGPSVMLGYWNQAQENERAFVEKAGLRWMRTGDLVRMDDEGYCHLHDRSQDLSKDNCHSVLDEDV